tara:strand:- start:517 stop:933 length:417 start_codon:yes stop_codon:yes gene_type:complete
MHHIIGLNQERQEYVDQFNVDLQKQLSIYGNNYDKVVSQINDDRMYAGRVDLLSVDTGAIYEKQKLQFKPSNSNFGIGKIENQAEMKKDNLNKEAADKYNISVKQYKELKTEASEIYKKTNTEVTPKQVQGLLQNSES